MQHRFSLPVQLAAREPLAQIGLIESVVFGRLFVFAAFGGGLGAALLSVLQLFERLELFDFFQPSRLDWCAFFFKVELGPLFVNDHRLVESLSQVWHLGRRHNELLF